MQLWDLDHAKLKCAWCGDFNHDIKYINHKVVDGSIIPINIERRHKAPNLCFSKNDCLSKSLNRNSIQFISMAYGISIDEASVFLQSRSKSPFYEKNYKNKDDYIKSQSRSREWFESTGKNRSEWIDKANYSRSVEKLGYDKWAGIQKNKSITLDSMQQKYGEQDGLKKYNEWKQSITTGNDAYIKKYGKIKGTEIYLKNRILSNTSGSFDDFINYLINIVKKNDLYEYMFFNIEKYMHKQKCYTICKEFFGVDVFQINSAITEKLPEYGTKPRKIFKNKWSYYSYTNNGDILKSMNEIKAYDFLLSLNLNDGIDFEVNKCYPDSKLHYDLYFPKINTYVEIAGSHDAEYRQHLKNKKTQFDTVIIIEPEHYKTQLSKIVEKLNECK
jgi:hypothetical protein